MYSSGGLIYYSTLSLSSQLPPFATSNVVSVGVGVLFDSIGEAASIGWKESNSAESMHASEVRNKRPIEPLIVPSHLRDRSWLL